LLVLFHLGGRFPTHPQPFIIIQLFFVALSFVFVAGIVGGAILLPCINCDAKRQRRINFSYLISPELQMEPETRALWQTEKRGVAGCGGVEQPGGSLMHSVACHTRPLSPRSAPTPLRGFVYIKLFMHSTVCSTCGLTKKCGGGV